MSRDEIDRAVRDAQRYAAEDAKLKAEATARDRCEQLIFQAGNAKNLSKDDKVRAIRYLNDAGAFLITKSGDRVCKFFGISKYTLYSYIDESKA